MSKPVAMINSLLQDFDPTDTEEKKQNFNNDTQPALVHNYRIPKGKINSDATITVYNFIGNKYYKPSSDKYFDNYNPATNHVISRIARSNASDINFAVSAAKQAKNPRDRKSTDELTHYIIKLSKLIE
eukprot:353318_1